MCQARVLVMSTYQGGVVFCLSYTNAIYIILYQRNSTAFPNVKRRREGRQIKSKDLSLSSLTKAYLPPFKLPASPPRGSSIHTPGALRSPPQVSL